MLDVLVVLERRINPLLVLLNGNSSKVMVQRDPHLPVVYFLVLEVFVAGTMMVWWNGL
jgi:hypothetical protein